MAWNPSPRYIYNDNQNGMNVHDMNDFEPIQLRVSTIRQKPYYDDYQYQDTNNNNNRYQTPKSENRICCSKACIIGLIVGLVIGAIAVVATALPIALTKKSQLGTIATSPNWVGTYELDTSCDLTACCCLSNQLTMYTTSSNQIQVIGTLAGICTNVLASVSYAQTAPTGFTLSFPWSGAAIRIIMGQDNSYIGYVVGSNGYCSGTGLRTSFSHTNINNINIYLILSLLLITISISLQ
ncbi:unnamed protein product [Adineta steineri]|uniref:Uncharacterized protein n=1 Tax=Adineta steineri TaxID=433720 RepID=A0A814KMS8_9BILA|nr:unnamed protein product [Adineta steineri]CAF1052949.1 unnamed protein product [Adineta steineri]CAF1120186.1 unnamed protein product [Adineta steineri]